MNQKNLQPLFVAIILLMLAVTTWATLEENVLAGFFHVTNYRWGWATLADAYFGFLTFYCWVAYREKTTRARIGWFVAIMTTGNMAMSVYILMQLRKGPLFQERA